MAYAGALGPVTDARPRLDAAATASAVAPASIVVLRM